MSHKRYSDEYIIIYTNGRTIQGQTLPFFTSKVDMLNRAKVQGAFSTYCMLYLIEENYHQVKPCVCLSLYFVCATRITNLSHVGDCWKNMGISHILVSHILSIMTKGYVRYDDILLIMELIIFHRNLAQILWQKLII